MKDKRRNKECDVPMRLGHLDLAVLWAKRTGIKNKKTPLRGEGLLSKEE